MLLSTLISIMTAFLFKFRSRSAPLRSLFSAFSINIVFFCAKKKTIIMEIRVHFAAQAKYVLEARKNTHTHIYIYIYISRLKPNIFAKPVRTLTHTYIHFLAQEAIWLHCSC